MPPEKHINVKKPRRRGRRIGRFFLIVVTLFVLAVLYSLTNSGTSRVVDYVVSNFIPLESARVEYDSVTGNLYSGLKLSGVRLVDENGDSYVVADSMSIDYELRSLISNHLKFGKIRLVRPTINIEQTTDGTWDLLGIFPSDPTDAPPQAQKYLSISRLEIVDGQINAKLNRPGQDSLLSGRQVNVDLNSLEFGSAMAFNAQHVSGTVSTVTTPTPIALFFKGAVSNSESGFSITTDSATVKSDRSNISSNGTVNLTTILTAPDATTDFHILADPIHFGDISPFFASVDPSLVGVSTVDISGENGEIKLKIGGGFSDESGFDISATLAPASSAERKYEFTGFTRNLDLNKFWKTPVQGRLSSTFSGDLYGATLDSLGGVSQLSITSPVTIGLSNGSSAESSTGSSFVILPSTFDATFTDGLAVLSTVIDSDVALAEIQGRVRPFDVTPSFSSEIQFSRLMLEDLLAVNADPLSGRLTATGSGSTLTNLAAEVTMVANASRINRLSFDRLEINSEIAGGSATFDGLVLSNSGSAQFTGRAELNDAIRIDVDRLLLDSFDVAALLGDTTASSLSGLVSGTARLPEKTSEKTPNRNVSNENGFRDLDIRAEFGAPAFRASTYGLLELQHGDFTVAGSSDLLDISGNMLFSGSEINFNAKARKETAGFKLRNGTVTFVGLQVENYAAVDVRSMLNGEFSFANITPRSQTLEWTLRLDSSAVNDASIKVANASGSFFGDSLRYNAALESESGTATSSGVVLLAGLKPTSYRIENLALGNFNIAAFAGSEKYQSRINAQGKGESIASNTGLWSAAEVVFTSSEWNGLKLDSGLIESNITNGAGPFSVNLKLGDGSILVDGELDVSESEPTYRLTGNLSNFPIATLVNGDSIANSISLDLAAEGSGYQLATMTSVFSLKGDSSSYGTAQIESIDISGAIRNGAVSFDSGEISSNIADISLAGTLGLLTKATDSDLEVIATVKDARPLNAFFKKDFDIIGDGIFFATVTGARGSEVVNLDTDLKSVVYGDFRAGGLTAEMAGVLNDSLTFSDFESNVSVEHFSTPSITVRKTDIDVSRVSDSLMVNVFTTIDNRRDGLIEGAIDLADTSIVLFINKVELNLDDDHWGLLQPSTLSFQDHYEIRNFLIFTDDQQIALDGIVDLDGDQNLLLTVEEFRMGAIADLLGFTGLDGTVNGYLDLTGPADSPVMQGDLISSIESFGKSYGDLNLILSYESLKLELNGLLKSDDGSSLTIDGHVPVNLRLAPSSGQTESGIRVSAGQAELTSTVDLALVSDNFSLDWILPFLDPEFYSAIGGKVTGNVNVGGTVSDPVLEGEALLSTGHIGLTAFGLVYKDISGALEFSDRTIKLQRIQIASGGGELIATGTVNLAQLTLGEFDIALSAENFLAVDNDMYKGRVVADLELTGTTTAPFISGYTNVVSGEMFLTEEYVEFEAVELTQADLLEVERVFGIRIAESDTSTFDFYKALALDINLELERNTWLRAKASPQMDIQFTGDLDMQKSMNEDMQIFGNIDVIPERSQITELGKRFRIVEGALTFNGPATDPELNIEAHHTIRSKQASDEGVTIILLVKGQLNDLKESPLDSDPKMDLADILSYLAFGRPARETLQFNGAGGENLAKDIALGQATGYLEGLAGSELGFDVFEIEQRDFETRLTAGKYLTQRLFVSVSQPISFSGQASELSDENIREITAEFELIQHLLLKLTQRESLKFDLLWQYSY